MKFSASAWLLVKNHHLLVLLFFLIIVEIFGINFVEAFNNKQRRSFTHTYFSSSTTDDSESNSDIMITEENPDAPRWCEEQQIYIDGKIPENAQVKEILEKENGYLRLFGYGSLCWNPGTTLGQEGVSSTLGKAKGYKRCWAQKSTDHRGNPSFPGIVCTLLKDSEVRLIKNEPSVSSDPSMTEGKIYTIPPPLVEQVLEELDFREKGGYARDIIDVVEDESGEIHQALLYRGTPDNPAMWERALLDLPFAAGMYKYVWMQRRVLYGIYYCSVHVHVMQ
jgi:cation transport regulator ChaC